MAERRVIIVGGGLAGLSAGTYAGRSGYRTTIVEHGLSLGGVCTAWPRGAYLVDGCIHWLTGGPFTRVYEELGILPSVAVRPLETWSTYRDASDGFELPFTRDLGAFVSRVSDIAPEDASEIARLRGAAAVFADDMHPPIDAVELFGVGEAFRSFWEMRGALPTLVHYRKPISEWVREHLKSERLRRVFTRMLPETAPAAFLLMVLGYLEKGWLSRPVGGTAAFRDALERAFREAGGEAILHSTVDEVLVRHGRAAGVRLADGTMLDADVVISTASAPETVLRLLGGRYDAASTRERLENWKLFDPIVLASFGVTQRYERMPHLGVIDRVRPFELGGRASDRLYVRVCNDDPCFAPPGHSVVQAMLGTDYQWWATRGTRYELEKERAASVALEALSPYFPRLQDSVEMTDIATPLTFWTHARAWRGAYEGWMPSAGGLLGHLRKRLAGLEGFYMAGQWVEPGGGVPTAVTSGRQAVQILCADEARAFIAR